MTPEMRKKLEERATQIANEAAMPILRDMYPSRSRGQMANEFRHFILTGAQAYESLLAETAGQDVEKAAEAHARQELSDLTPRMSWFGPLVNAFKAGDAHGYARARAELSPKNLISKTHAAALVAEAVKAERERCANVVRTCSCPDGPESFDVCCRCALKLILNPNPKEGA